MKKLISLAILVFIYHFTLAQQTTSGINQNAALSNSSSSGTSIQLNQIILPSSDIDTNERKLEAILKQYKNLELGG
jgi:hypothetical protein